ncbi:helix-turn-helix domain-containing protein [Streptomyces sp. NPDC001780]
MDTRNTSVPPHASSAVADGPRHSRANRRPRVRPPTAGPAGVVHDNVRHTTRFTVIGNHLAQHDALSLLAIGLGVHIQSLPPGARVDIKTLAHRFPEGASRIAAALRELEAYGYLRRVRERTPAGRIVTRTISCNQPAATRHHTSALPDLLRPPVRSARTVDAKEPDASHATPDTHPEPASPTRPTHPMRPTPPPRPAPRKKRPLPAVPQPGYPAPDLLQAATDLLTDLRVHDSRLLLSACDTAHLAPGVAAWLERDVPPAAVTHALISDLPPEGPRRPAALLAHRLTTKLPPPPPFRAPAAPPPVVHPLQTCDGCDRAFRSPEPGTHCADCRSPAPADGRSPSEEITAPGRITELRERVWGSDSPDRRRV